MRALCAVAAVVTLSGCLPLHLWHKKPRPDPVPDRRAVVTKEAPTSLIAADGSRCLVGENKFAHTDIGDRVWCVWSAKDGRRTAYTWDDNGEPSGRHRPESGGFHIGGWP